MTTARESEILTRVGPGTPMGRLMREYWIPAAKSSELTADGDPMRLRLLGENLIAFRDSQGRVGIMDHRCPHRCASLFFGRNEEGGIRCVYHGWKFDVEGNCTDMANVPPHQDFKHKVHAKAYRVAERNGLIWVYMGERQVAPPLPQIEAAVQSDVEIVFSQRECNWLQALEGDIDTSHLGFLHLGAVHKGSFEGLTDENVVANRAPEYICEETPCGTTYGAYRPSEDGNTYWRFAHFLFPFWTMPPVNPFERNMIVRGWVPIDDTHMMFVMIYHKDSRPGARPVVTGVSALPAAAMLSDERYLPNTTDWLGRFRLRANRDNDYEIDREVQRTQTYTGIEGIHLQDQAVTESMGEITDHTFEHLAPSDIMIAKTRRRLLSAVQEFLKDGIAPPTVDDPTPQARQRGGSFVADRTLDWRDAYGARVAANVGRGALAAE